jgi:hypothetical protein
VTAVRFGNFFPVSIAWVQAQVDDILSYRTGVDDSPLDGPTGLTRQRYYSRPVDAFTIARYMATHGGAIDAERRSLPVAQLAAMLARGEEPPTDLLRADRLLDTYHAMAVEARSLAEAAAERPVNDPAEVHRYVQDAECLILTVEFYRHKVRAALAKRLFQLTGERRHAEALRAHIVASVPAYEAMMATARRYYRAGSSMWDAKPWERCLAEKVIPDRDAQLAWLAERGL